MVKRASGTVKETGAEPLDILIGVNDLNRGLRIKVYKNQTAAGGRIIGNFDVLSTGNGKYTPYLNKLKEKSFDNAKTLIEMIRDLGGEGCTHILNRRELKIEK